MKKRYAYFVNKLGLGDQIFYVHLFVNSIVNDEKCILISNKIYPFIQFLYPDNHHIISESDNRLSYEPLDINDLNLNFRFNDNKYISPNNDKVIIGCSWKSFNSQYGIKKDIPIVDILKSLRGFSYQFENLQYGDIEKEKEEFKR